MLSNMTKPCEATEGSALQVKTYTDKSKSRFPVRYKCTDGNLLIVLEYNFLLNSCTLLCSLSILSSCSFDLGKSCYHKLNVFIIMFTVHVNGLLGVNLLDFKLFTYSKCNFTK